jgi:FMN phosphatase YigB (HAD superfamily)
MPVVYLMSLHPLIEISEHVRSVAREGNVAAIFDLDSTLFCVSPRTQHILRLLAEQSDFSEQYKEESAILRDLEVLPTDWGVRTVLTRTGMAATPELIRHVRAFWGRHFFSNDHLDKDVIYPAANEYVRHLHGLGARILYLTGRSDQNMRAGTLRALKKWGFPLDADDDLYMKPIDVEKDEAFKAEVLLRLESRFQHIWFFENEPVIIAQVRRLTPMIHIVFVNSTHSGKGTPPGDLRTIGMSYRDGLPSDKTSN